MAGISRVCTGFSNNPGIFRYTHFPPLMRRTISLRISWEVVLQDQLEEVERHSWIERTMFAVNTAFPQAEYPTWSQCERLLPHALQTVRYVEVYQIIGEEAGRLCYETASYLQDRARYSEAELLYQRALRIREQQLGPEHSQLAYPLSGLASIYYLQGKYADAEPLYQRALRIWEQQLGPEHPQVASPLHGLANLYYSQGKYAEAEPLYQRAQELQEQGLGAQHPKTAEVLHDFATFREAQGNYQESRILYQRALAIREQVFGLEHPETQKTYRCFTALKQSLSQETATLD